MKYLTISAIQKLRKRQKDYLMATWKNTGLTGDALIGRLKKASSDLREYPCYLTDFEIRDLPNQAKDKYKLPA